MRDDNFDSKNYVKVHERLAEFREAYLEGFITTFRSSDEHGTSFKTIICRSKEEAELFAATSISASTGHSYLSNEAYSEKAEEASETVSVGRALANLGFKIEKSIASKEEIDRYEGKPLSDGTEERQDDSQNEAKEAETPPAQETKLAPTRRFSGSRFA